MKISSNNETHSNEIFSKGILDSSLFADFFQGGGVFLHGENGFGRSEIADFSVLFTTFLLIIEQTNQNYPLVKQRQRLE